MPLVEKKIYGIVLLLTLLLLTVAKEKTLKATNNDIYLHFAIYMDGTA